MIIEFTRRTASSLRLIFAPEIHSWDSGARLAEVFYWKLVFLLKLFVVMHFLCKNAAPNIWLRKSSIFVVSKLFFQQANIAINRFLRQFPRSLPAVCLVFDENYLAHCDSWEIRSTSWHGVNNWAEGGAKKRRFIASSQRQFCICSFMHTFPKVFSWFMSAFFWTLVVSKSMTDFNQAGYLAH